MGAPNSIVSDILQLCILAGKRKDGQRETSVLQPEGVTPITQFGQDSWPHAALASDLFSYTVPKGQCLVVTFIDFHTGLGDGSDPAVNFGIPVSAPTQWKVTKAGVTVSRTSLLNVIAYTNCPCFFVFEPETLPILSVTRSTLVTADSLSIQAHMQGYLMDARFYNVFRKYQTIPVTT